MPRSAARDAQWVEERGQIRHADPSTVIRHCAEWSRVNFGSRMVRALSAHIRAGADPGLKRCGAVMTDIYARRLEALNWDELAYQYHLRTLAIYDLKAGIERSYPRPRAAQGI